MGSSTYAASVEAYGAEKEMYRSIINYLTGLDSRITCNTDVDTEWTKAEGDSNHLPTFNFSINNTPIFSLSRDSNIAQYYRQPSNVTIFKLLLDGTPTYQTYIRDKKDEPDTAVQNYVACTRGLTISHIINDNFILLSFAACSDAIVPNTTNTRYRDMDNATFALSLSNGQTYIGATKAASEAPYTPYSKAYCFNISDYTLYNVTTPSSVGTFVSRFSYAAPVGTIDYIKSTVYQSNNSKIFENKAVYDSTTVNVGDAVSLKDGSYVAVGTHQLVKVS